MRLVHFADTHIGFRRFNRLTKGGLNQREADVARLFVRVIDQTIAIAPDLVVIGGDVFHAVRPPNQAIDHAFGQFARLRLALPNTEVVMVAGNHDTPRVSDTGSPLSIFRHLGIHVVIGPAQRLDFPALDCSVLAVADNGHARPELAPAGSRRYNVLLLHGEAGGIGPTRELRGRELSDEALHADAWDYIALGHYHVYKQVAARAFYSGAIDYTTSNIWGERAEEVESGLSGKGIVERDLASGVQTFHPLPSSRLIADMAPIDATGLAVDEIDSAVRDALESIDIDGAIVRLIVSGLPWQSKVSESLLDRRMIRSYSARALNLQLDLRPDAKRERSAGSVMSHRMPLFELVRERLGARTLAPSVDRDALLAIGAHYLDLAGEDAAVQRSDEIAQHAAA